MSPRHPFRVAVGFVTVVAVVAITGAPASANHTGPDPQTYTAALRPLNNSGVRGTATLTLDRNRLTVTIEAQGVEPDQVHPQHIHGFDDAGTNAVCPPDDAADDIEGSPEESDNPNDFISVPEGLPFYGDILLPLQPFPTPDTDAYTFTETYSGKDLAPLQPGRTTLANRHIVIHGDELPNGTYLASLPVACGQIEPTG